MDASEVAAAHRVAPSTPDVSGLGGADYLIFLLLTGVPAFFALATWDPVGHSSAFQYQLRFFSVPVLAVELAVIFYALRRGLELSPMVRAEPGWMVLPLVVLSAVAIGTALFPASHQGLAIVRTCMWIVHILSGIGLLFLLSGRWRSLRPIFWPAITAGSCAYAAMLALLVVAMPDPQSFDWTGLGLAATHVRHTGYYSIVGAGAALGLAAVDTRRGRYWTWVGAATLMLALSFWSGTRGSVVAVAGALVVGAAMLPALRSVRLAAAAVTSFAGGVLLSLAHAAPSPYYGLFRMSRSVAGSTLHAVSSGRTEIWRGAFREIWGRPLFGHGESQFRLVVPEAVGVYNHPHNVALQLLFQWGIVGAACCFVLATGLLWRAYGRMQGGDAEVAPALLVLLGLLVFSLYDGSFYYPYPIVMMTAGLVFLLVQRRPV